ncbi:MAG: inositol monophosphatase, partial [Chitinophagaceae bacterium]|nr:inositol monophosphatase [Anaerolineae bacterium]
MTIDLQAARSIAIDIARQAAEVIIRYHEAGTFSQKTKQNAIDIVTEADQQAEIVIVQAIKARFPDHHIIGEEGGAMGASADASAYTWYIDPLDGTTNFANKIPIFATSIALTDRDMNPIVGVVYNPISGEMFSAAKGFGTTLNDKPIHVSRAETLEQSVL